MTRRGAAFSVRHVPIARYAWLMRWFVVLMALAACDESPRVHQHYMPPDAPKSTFVLDTIPMNIVVTPGFVEVWMEGIDFGAAQLACVGSHFALPGECNGYGDADPCGARPANASCLTDIAIEVDGQRVETTEYLYDPYVFGSKTASR